MLLCWWKSDRQTRLHANTKSLTASRQRFFASVYRISRLRSPCALKIFLGHCRTLFFSLRCCTDVADKRIRYQWRRQEQETLISTAVFQNFCSRELPEIPSWRSREYSVLGYLGLGLFWE